MNSRIKSQNILPNNIFILGEKNIIDLEKIHQSAEWGEYSVSTLVLIMKKWIPEEVELIYPKSYRQIKAEQNK